MWEDFPRVQKPGCHTRVHCAACQWHNNHNTGNEQVVQCGRISARVQQPGRHTRVHCAGYQWHNNKIIQTMIRRLKPGGFYLSGFGSQAATPTVHCSSYNKSQKGWDVPGISERWQPVLRIRDVYPGSRILIFTHPGSRISDPGSKNSNKRERLYGLQQAFFIERGLRSIRDT